MFDSDDLNVLTARAKAGIESLPFYLLGNEIFPLKPWLMRPYPGPMMVYETVKIFNYRHSRERRVIENAFGILCSIWRIFYKPIRASKENVEKYILTCMVLPNFLRQTDNAFYSPQGFVDSEDSNGEIKPGQWRSGDLPETANNCFKSLRALRGSRYGKEAFEMWENLKSYLNNQDGSLAWQWDYVHRTGSISSY